MKVKVNINQQIKVFECEPGDFLLDTLRKNNYLSVRRGCDTTNCGVCTVLLDGKPVPSCSLLTLKADGHEITTVEGIQAEAEKLGKYFGDEGADQCGFCSPGLIVNTVYLKKLKIKKIEEVKIKLIGNLCRCTGYVGQHRAIEKFLGVEK